MARSLLGAEADWSIDTHIAAFIADGIWVANWQRGGGKRSQYPKPVPRPGSDGTRDGETMLGTVRTFAEIDEMRERIRRG